MKATKISLMAVLALGGVMTFSPIAFAQDKTADAPKQKSIKPEPSARPARPRGQAIAEELNLTDEQKTKMQALQKEQNEKARALRDDTSLSQEDRRTKQRELRQQFTAKVKEVLNAEQFDKWEKARQGGGRAGAAPRGDRPPRQRGGGNRSGGDNAPVK